MPSRTGPQHSQTPWIDVKPCGVRADETHGALYVLDDFANRELRLRTGDHGKHCVAALQEDAKASDGRVVITLGNGERFEMPSSVTFKEGTRTAPVVLFSPGFGVQRQLYAGLVEDIASDPRFADVQLIETLKYPDGTDGFYFVRLNYSLQADAIFAAEFAARHKPVEEDITLNGQTVHTLHSQFDVGRIQDLFDGDPYTLARTDIDNPAIIELTFPTPRLLTGLKLTTGTMDFGLTITLSSTDLSAGQVYSQTYTGLPPDPTVSLNFGSTPASVKKIRIEIQDNRAGTDNHIHIREAQLIDND